MFIYSNPTGDPALEGEALESYRAQVHQQYSRCAAHRKSAFTHLHAFDGVQTTAIDHVTWPAFPKVSSGIDLAQIDQQRSDLQDEYVEWCADRSGGRVSRVTFTTEFHEPFLILARQGLAAAVDGIRNLYPNSHPTGRELFGIDDSQIEQLSPDDREQTFQNHVQRNPWNNGEFGILFLTHRSNNMFALFELANDCATPNLSLAASDVCAKTNCAVGRNSDPAVCQALQLIARADRSLALTDAPGVTIRKLGGVWELNGVQIDVNAPAANVWQVSRNRRRGVLEVSAGLTLAGEPIRSGAQVAKALQVGVSVLSAPDADLPFWARRGNESTRRV